MSLTFASRSLQRTFALDDLTTLTNTQLGILHAELVKAIEAMDDKIKEVQADADSDWLHRVNKKKAICQTFTEQVAELRLNAHGTFEHIYKLKLEELLLDELGKDTWLEIKAEAMEFALASHPPAALTA